MTVCCGMRLVLVTPPAVEPLTADEARARLNIGDEVSDEVMNAYITAARQRIDGADGYLGRAINTQTWEGRADTFPTCDGGRIYIPLPPLQTVTVTKQGSVLDWIRSAELVIYTNCTKGVEEVRHRRRVLNRQPDAVPRRDVLYGDAGSDVPEPIRTAVALGAGHLRSMTARDLSVSEEVEEGIGSTRYVVSQNAGDLIDYPVECLLSTYQVMYV